MIFFSIECFFIFDFVFENQMECSKQDNFISYVLPFGSLGNGILLQAHDEVLTSSRTLTLLQSNHIISKTSKEKVLPVTCSLF